MRHRVSILLPVLLAMATVLASPLDGATVSLGLISKRLVPHDLAGERELWAWTSAGDNDGISSYSIELVGERTEGQHTSPLVVVFDDEKYLVYQGFTIGRNSLPDPTGRTTLFWGQGSFPESAPILSMKKPPPRGSMLPIFKPDLPSRAEHSRGSVVPCFGPSLRPSVRNSPEYRFDFPLIWDGLNAARGRLFLTTIDGSVSCDGPK